MINMKQITVKMDENNTIAFYNIIFLSTFILFPLFLFCLPTDLWGFNDRIFGTFPHEILKLWGFNGRILGTFPHEILKYTKF